MVAWLRDQGDSGYTDREEDMSTNWVVGDVFVRDGDSAEHKIIATCEDGLRVLVRRQSWGLARSFQYFMDARIAPGQERVAS